MGHSEGSPGLELTMVCCGDFGFVFGCDARRSTRPLLIVPAVHMRSFTALEALESVKLKQLRITFTLLSEASTESVPQYILLGHCAGTSVTF